MRSLSLLPGGTTVCADERYGRQMLAFGHEGQRRLQDATVAVVGAGGIGSLLVCGLARLGSRRLIIVDPDHVEPTNLNRLAGATDADARHERPKVQVAARTAKRINPDLSVHPVHGSVLDTETWSSLRCADLVFGAVDGHAARWALNCLAVQYARHYIDTGAEITRRGDGTLDVSGHVAVVSPGGLCLLCLSGYDPAAASRELNPALTTAKRAAGYLRDAPDEPTPSVIFLNQAIAAAALAEAHAVLTGWRLPQRYLLLDLTTPTLTTMDAAPEPTCPACGPTAPRADGDATSPPHFTEPAPPPQT